MKKLFLIALLLLPVSVMASGYICDGKHFNVKLFNHVHPDKGTKNPAVLIISVEDSAVGTIARISGEEIESASESIDANIYEATTQNRHSGRFMHVSFDVRKKARTDGRHLGHLVIHADGDEYLDTLSCKYYRKLDLEDSDN